MTSSWLLCPSGEKFWAGRDIGDDDGAGDESLRWVEGREGALTGVAVGVGNGCAVESPLAAISYMLQMITMEPFPMHCTASVVP